MVNEILDSHIKSKGPRLDYKLDFAKAFNTISWDFMDNFFHKFSFGWRWRKGLRVCWLFARFSLLCNGSFGGFLKL